MDTATVAVSTLQDTIRRALAKYPEDRARIERAAALIALGNVQRVTDEAYAVISQADPSVVYTVTRGHCPCTDQQRHPELICKHRWACSLLVIAEERQRRLDIRANLTPVELERLARWKRKYEAVAP